MTAKTIFAITLAAAVASAPGLSAAEESSGTVTYVTTQVEFTDLAGGGKLRRGHSKGVILADDPASVFHLAAQDCSGTTVIGADGKVMFGSGSCNAVDRDGDTWAIWYSNSAAGRIWNVIGGTGKYANLTGGGTTEVLMLTRDGRMTISWKGDLRR